MTAAIPARLMPKEGADFQFEGTPVSYEPKPFVMTMKDGAILTAKGASRSKEASSAQEASGSVERSDKHAEDQKGSPLKAAFFFWLAMSRNEDERA